MLVWDYSLLLWFHVIVSQLFLPWSRFIGTRTWVVRVLIDETIGLGDECVFEGSKSGQCLQFFFSSCCLAHLHRHLHELYCIVTLKPYSHQATIIYNIVLVSCKALNDLLLIFPMEDVRLPGLQKSTSFDAALPQKQNRASHFHPDKAKVGSFPQLPQGAPSFNRSMILKKLSCCEPLHEQPEAITERNILYGKAIKLIEEMVGNPGKFQLLLSALQSMEGSLKKEGKSKTSLESNKSQNQKLAHKTSQGSIECRMGDSSSQKLSVSFKLSASECAEEKKETRLSILPNNKYEICDFMAESIEIEYPYNSDLALEKGESHGEKGSSGESENILHFSAARSIEEQMMDSLPQLTHMYKRISLLLAEEKEEGSDLFSSTSSVAPKFPTVTLTPQLVASLFEEASPLLMNLALSLLFKFMLRSKVKLCSDNTGWLLGLCALIAYKIFYDETLEGILEYFAGILGVEAEEAARLERWFLGELNYQVLINNKHYAEIMIKLMGSM